MRNTCNAHLSVTALTINRFDWKARHNAKEFFFYFCLYMIHLYALHVLLSLNKFSITLQIPHKHYLVIKEVNCMPIQLERQRFQKGNIIRHHL